jgi:hypothetical protein
MLVANAYHQGEFREAEVNDSGFQALTVTGMRLISNLQYTFF